MSRGTGVTLQLSFSAQRLIETIHESTDKVLTMSQARVNMRAVNELLDNGLLVHGTWIEGIEVYRLTSAAQKMQLKP